MSGVLHGRAASFEHTLTVNSTLALMISGLGVFEAREASSVEGLGLSKRAVEGQSRTYTGFPPVLSATIVVLPCRGGFCLVRSSANMINLFPNG